MLEDWQRIVTPTIAADDRAAAIDARHGARGLGWLMNRFRQLARAT